MRSTSATRLPGVGQGGCPAIPSARRGDEAAIRILYDRHSSHVYALTRQLTGDDTLAEDCAQEAWVCALKGLASYRGEAAFSTWLHRIAINSTLSVRGRAWRRKEREVPLDDAVQSPRSSGEPLLRVRLDRALRALPERMRQVVVLHDVEGLTHQEIGELLGIRVGTSKSQLFRARAKLRERLRPHGRTVREQVALCG